MSLETNLRNWVTKVATDIKELRLRVGNATSLSTSDKTSLVAAINEVNAKPTSTGGASINDAAASGTTTYSGNRIETRLTETAAATKTEILGGASAQYDSFKEIQDLLAAQDTDDAAVLTALGNRVRFDAAQTLTAAQKQQANTNMGSASLAQIGDPEVDLVEVYNAAVA